MKFLIQEDSVLDFESKIIEDIINNQLKGLHHYKTCVFDELEVLGKYELSNYIPIGSIEFVEKWLNIVHNIEKINPIEIPSILRTDEFLKRNYYFARYNELPKSGNYFIKDVSVLKGFSYIGNISLMDFNQLDKTHLFQVSNVVDIVSEYRVYIINGKVDAVIHYNGNPLTFPNAALINKANILWSMQKDYPMSCTLDIIVNKDGTSICECHPFIAIGLYTNLWGSGLLQAYKDGIDYVVRHNTKIEDTII